jgi:hypothetical protein
LTSFVIDRFAGLNLLADPLELGASGAVDLLNVWFLPGRIETCPEVLAFATATRTVLRIFPYADGSQLLASEGDGTTTTLEAFTSGGVSSATTSYASVSTTPHGFASIGTPSASRTYAVRRGDTTRRWDGSAWSSVAGVPSGVSAAPADRGTRLAVGYASGNPHRVSFSDAGDPETFGANNYVDIAPGDGESIGPMVYWGDRLFAFKNTKFMVFGQTGIDATGSPIFDYYTIDTGHGVGLKGVVNSGGACAGPDGVYFVSTDGVWRTTGSTPVLVSSAISPLWPYAQSNPLTTVPQISLGSFFDLSCSFDGTLFLTATGQTAGRTVTLALVNGEWTYLDVQHTGTSGAGNFTQLRSSVYYTRPGSTAIRQLKINDGPDASLSWSYKTGRYAIADPGKVAINDYSSLTGSGTVTLTIDSDRYSAQSASATLGTAPAIAEGWPSPLDNEGKWFQSTLSGTGAAVVNRLRHNVASVRLGD